MNRCQERSLSQDDWEFIFTAVEAGWTTPRIAKEVDAPFMAVLYATRLAREEMRIRLKVCEHCRRKIARANVLSSALDLAA